MRTACRCELADNRRNPTPSARLPVARIEGTKSLTRINKPWEIRTHPRHRYQIGTRLVVESSKKSKTSIKSMVAREGFEPPTQGL